MLQIKLKNQELARPGRQVLDNLFRFHQTSIPKTTSLKISAAFTTSSTRISTGKINPLVHSQRL